MTRRRTLLLVMLTAASVPLLGLGVYLAMPPKPGVTRENFRRIHQEMSQEQVEALLGSPGEYLFRMTGSATYGWEGAQGTAAICFTADGAATGGFCGKDKGGVVLAQLPEKPRGVADTIRQWVKDWTGR